MVDGQDRSFLLRVPESYIIHDPVPLIVAFHGRTNSNEQVRQYYELDRTFTKAIIAYPAASSNGSSFRYGQAEVQQFDRIVELPVSYTHLTLPTKA